MKQAGSVCSIGVMAYNEERNIGRLLEALRHQKTVSARVAQIVVVASGCTDRTEEVVAQAARADARVRLIVQARREGKARAINLFLQAARDSGADLCVLQSGDTLPQDNTLEALLRPFAENPSVGMTGAHVVPVNGHGTFVGGAVQTLWRLHHRLASESPKMGELIAFRNVVAGISEESAVDEVSIESEVIAKGFTLRYAPDAIVLNKGPETVSDFLKQRRRIHAGHLAVGRQAGYSPATMKLSRVARHFLADMIASPGQIPASLGAAGLEALGRTLGAWDFYIARRSHAVWEIAVTTKDVQGN